MNTLEIWHDMVLKRNLDRLDEVLEFTREVDGIVVNGVDIIAFDDEGKIIEFKVMLRSLKAVNLMHAKMREMLEQISA